MVNNSTNINKTNNHLSYQIIQYKQTIAYYVGDSGHDLGQAEKSGGVKPVNGIFNIFYELKYSARSNVRGVCLHKMY